MSEKVIQSVRGFTDILPPDSLIRAKVLAVIKNKLRQFSYLPASLPLLEKTALFKRSIGDDTDIVGKEMYSFLDRDGEDLSLRPEGTAGAVRALIENGKLQEINRIYIEGEMFRHEKPQAGRYRQFSQISVECLGLASWAEDVELILLSHEAFSDLGIREALKLEINTIGLAEERKKFQKALVEFLTAYEKDLDEDSQRRLKTNPLRILDSKDAKTQEILNKAPKLGDFLGEDSKAHFAKLCESLDALKIPYVINEKLVRGLDYYCHSVFEWTTTELGAQGTVCAGGRYDGLVEQLGGKATPAAGFAFGIDRIVLLKQKIAPFAADKADFYVICEPNSYLYALEVCRQIRAKKPELSFIFHNDFQAFKKQFKKAGDSGAKFALVFGENEKLNQLLTWKNLENGEQQTSSLEEFFSMSN